MLNDVADLYAANPALFAGSVFVLGLVVGSFLNVVIYRLPIMLEREWRAQAAEFTASAATASRRPYPTRPRRLPAERFNLAHAALRLPRLQGADHRLAQHPGAQLARAARTLRRLQGAASPRAIPAVELATGILSAWAAWHFGFGAAAACAVPGHLGPDRAHRHRHRPSAAARQHHPAAAVGGTPGGGRCIGPQPGARTPRVAARCHHRAPPPAI